MPNKQKTTPYTPKKDSIPYKVLSFFLRNQDEELTRDDIAVKFGANHASIDSLLSIAKSKGALVTSRNSAMKLVWKMGDAKSFSLELEDPEIKTPIENFRNTHQSNTEISHRKNLSFEGMPFESKITKNGDPQKFKKSFDEKKSSYEKWFSNFEVNDTAAFDLKYFYKVVRLATNYSKREKRVFRCKKRKEGYAEIIRIS